MSKTAMISTQDMRISSPPRTVILINDARKCQRHNLSFSPQTSNKMTGILVGEWCNFLNSKEDGDNAGVESIETGDKCKDTDGTEPEDSSDEDDEAKISDHTIAILEDLQNSVGKRPRANTNTLLSQSTSLEARPTEPLRPEASLEHYTHRLNSS